MPNPSAASGAQPGRSSSLALLAALAAEPDAQLVEAAKEHEPHAFEALMRRHNRRLFRVARSILEEFGLAGVNLHTYTGWGSVPYWNAFVANIEMGGLGILYDPRLNDPVKFPIAAKAGFFDIRDKPDLISRNSPRCSSTSSRSRRHFSPEASTRTLRRRAGIIQRRREVREVSRAAAFHGARLEHAHAGGDRDRSFQALAGPGRPSHRRRRSRAVHAIRRAASITTVASPRSPDAIAHYDRFMRLGLSEHERGGDLEEYLKSL